MKIINKQKRKTTIWQYLGVAAVPLLLVFFGGLSLGRLGHADDQSYQKKYAQTQAQLDSAEAKLAAHQALMFEALEYLGQMEELDEMEDQMEAAFNSGDADLGKELSTDIRNDLRDIDSELEYLEESLGRVEGDSLRMLSSNLLETLREYTDTRQSMRRMKEMNLSLRAEAGVVPELTQTCEELEDQLDAANDQLALKELEIQSTKLDVRSAELNLQNCLAQTGQATPPPDYTTQVAKIQAEVDFINNEILPDLRGKVIGKGQIDELRDRISARLITISTTLASIQ
jgi:hypothetical protein